MSARELDQLYQNNYISVGNNASSYLFDTLDDSYGSLGTYTLKSAVIGTAYREVSGNVYLECDYIGFYIKDFYDFNNDRIDQPLGLWTENGILTRSDLPLVILGNNTIYKGKQLKKVSAIHNSDFLNYRTESGKGGDFVIFSDVLWLKIKGTHQLPWG